MKKTFIKILSVVLCAVMVLGAAPLGGLVGLDLPGLFDLKAEAATYSGTCGDNITWSLDSSTGVLNIAGTGAMTNYSSSSSVPWYSYRSYIKTVNIASGVTSIGKVAFYYCESLTSVTIPDSVTTIGDSAFSDCESLTSVTIPDSVTTIGDDAFYNCTSLTSVTIPDSVTSIGDSAFEDCTSLTSITIPNSVTTIGEDAFFSCNSLTSVTIGNSVTTIGEDAFAFCTSLTSVTIPDSVTTIGVYAFGACSGLTSVTIPDSVTTIGDYAFVSCTSLTSITVDEDNKYFSSNSYGVLFNKDKTTLIQYPIGNTRTSYTIPDSVTTIGSVAFGACSGLTSVTIPDSVTTIGEGAFEGCTSLTSVTIPDSVTTIGNDAFAWCDRLTSVTIGNSVTTIDARAFYYCDSLKDVYYIGTQAQWNKITIGSYNTPLTSATIHYNSTGPNNNFTYSQQHVVNNYKTANSDYAKMYLAGTAQPMDGSNGNPDLCIPGLKLGENMVPQGVAYYPAKNWLLISAYYNDAKKNSTVPSAVFALDMATGKMVEEYRLYTSDKKPYTGHVGGIAVSDYNLYITSGSNIAYIPLSDLDNGSMLVIKDKADFSSYLGEAETSYLSINNGILFTGNFYYAKDSRYNKPAKDAKSVIVMQRLGGNNSELEWEEVCNPGVSAVVKVPDSIDKIQGVTFHDGKFYISSSFGRTNKSIFYITDMIGATLKIEYKYDALPMMEGITFVGDYIYAVHESASAFYLKGLDGKGKSADPTDVVWKIDYKELGDPYNLGDETYCFGNYVDEHSSDGHCFGMSITSAGYHLRILDITSIGGNIYDGLYSLNDSATVRKPICYYQDIQGEYVIKSTVAGGSDYVNLFNRSDIDSDWKAVVNYVKNREYDNKGTLQIVFGQGDYYHAVNFLRYAVVDGQERIYVYDNNFPETEVYFYKSADGSILEAPKETFSGAITCMGIVNVEKYFSIIGDYDSTRYIFADKGSISVSGAIEYPLICAADEARVLFEIPEGKEKVVIVPLVENAEFEYLGVTYNFDRAEAGQIGEFVLAQDEETAGDTVELTFIDLPEKFEIKTPSITTVKYGDTLVLHADLGEAVLPEGLSIQWTVDGAGFNMTPAEDGLTCNMTSTANGDATVKATLVDETGYPIFNADSNEISDEITLKSNASFWQKIVSFFKNLFRINRIIPE